MEPQLDVAGLEQLIQEITEDLHALEEKFVLIVNREKDWEYHLCEFKDHLKMRKNILQEMIQQNKNFPEEYSVIIAKLEKLVEEMEEKEEIHKEQIADIKHTMESLQQTLDGLRQMLP